VSTDRLHTMPVKVESFFSSRKVRTMRWDEKGAYLLLLAEAWLDGCRLPNDRAEIRALLGVDDDDDWARIDRSIIDRCFTVSDDGKWLENKRLIEERDRVLQAVEKRSAAGRKAARAREAKRARAGTSGAGTTAARSTRSAPNDRSSIVQQSQLQSQSYPDTPSNPPQGGTSRFDAFWDVYPKKVGKKAARAKWKSRKLDRMADRIIADVKARSARHRQWLEGFVPNPTTYINQDRWEDEIVEFGTTERKPQGGGGNLFATGGDA